ncbi:Crp/Fnr family transcriptional regulator [Cytophaga hutchinsonii]|jgi:CRP-like cAMP-binding protein|uniref:Cyclic nucleotide binding regulatory protein n=1 Tax=Cytophaga hutchinsonii (strain ATCC 33406 / DSM 1761 / CIP 103989 / NBRC 15051 / NCIMB 9469 / D465) TaxID=269798 RepID=A0A6N4SWZ5_CYTH3|nr:Crp/Fnr family transcriptional regulator [Cytophaga hutchinsonii]ABG60996.1 cyclic nucleotide binding regulatory protein [Cytophaga hutchinsonii ATCC 33406]SFX44003.1 cAMP-binding domain of CRP or a regulatory subunit of cAMP-dependent protein kinases [Cytophaga hutchinsonii ATCC 33406]
MIPKSTGYLADLNIHWKNYIQYLHKIEVAPKTKLQLLHDVANRIFIVESGSVRMGFEKDGKDITLQFFFEDELVASVESLFNQTPSKYFIETIEHSTIYYLTKEMLEVMALKLPEMANITQDILMSRLIYYSNHLHSYISETPEQRFNKLIETRPYIFMRVSQRHIASYLGITNVSLSRIKARKSVVYDQQPATVSVAEADNEEYLKS